MTFFDGPTVTLHAFAVGHPWLTPVVILVTAAFLVMCPIWFVGCGSGIGGSGRGWRR
jgi:hypothetical protein